MPITTAKEIILVRVPSTTDDTRLDDHIALAETILDETFFKSKYQYAISLQVLHWYALNARGGGSSENASGIGGPVTNLKEGDLSISYGFSSAGDRTSVEDDLSQTTYGKELLALKRACAFTPITRMSCL